MKIEIAEEIIQKTTKCEKKFKCLSCNPEELCKIICAIKPQLSIIECAENTVCSYWESYGKTKTCKCPVRNEIYNRYKL